MSSTSSRGTATTATTSAATTQATASPAARGTTGAPSGTAGPGDPVVGLVADASGWGDQAGARIDAVQARTGVRWLREELRWSEVEPTPGVFRWASTDRFMTAAAQRGVRVLPLLMGTPSWAGATWSTLPSPVHYARYVAATVERYGPGGSFWREHPALDAALAPKHFELWNEPYYAFFAGGVYDPVRYAAMAQAAIDAGKAANPAARFLVAAEFTGEQAGERWVPWTEAMLAAQPRLARSIDGLAVHPYGDDLGAFTGGHRQVRRMEHVRQRFAAAGRSDVPLWITEVGATTCSGEESCVSEERQAAWLEGLGRIARDPSLDVRALFVYRYDDLGEGRRADPEQWYGLTRHDGSAKPALDVFRSLVARAPADVS